MSIFLKLFVLVPLLGYFINLLLPNHNERLLSFMAVATTGINLVLYSLFLIFWFNEGIPTLNIKEIELFKSNEYEFFIDFYFDPISAVFLFVGYFLSFLITIYCRTYFHRESGHKRFFNTILLFYMGYNFIVLAGNMETMFIGWEILGISSFLLIAFYRTRFLPVNNAVKVYSVYRLGDLGLIIAIWLTHHFFQENITFSKLSNYDLVHEHLQQHSIVGVFISVMILITASAKSAQFPFTSWLPKAMEGPTPSSAIFYGSLSVHIGVFLLLRMQPFWEHQSSVRLLIGFVGLMTSVSASGMARVQSSIKSKIAYSSAAQIGIIFIEIAAGFETIALLHFMGNAFLRTYQLLISPSVVTYLIREQLYSTIVKDSLRWRIPYSSYFKNTWYMLNLKEWYLDEFMYSILWAPAKIIGRKFYFITTKSLLVIFLPAYFVGLILLYVQTSLPSVLHFYLPIAVALVALLLLIKSFTEKVYIRRGFLLIVMSQFWLALAIAFNEEFSYFQTFLFLSGIISSGLIGYIVLQRVRREEGHISLMNYNGHVYKHPKLALLFLLACLGLTGFPITPTFIGEDLIFTHIHEDQWILALLVSLCFLVDGFSIIRLYAKVFLGPSLKNPKKMSYKFS